MKRSYHCRKIRRLQRDTVSLDLHVMVLQQEMTRLYADQAEVAEMMSDLKVRLSILIGDFCLILLLSKLHVCDP